MSSRTGPWAYRSLEAAVNGWNRWRDDTGHPDNLTVSGYDRDGSTWLMYTATDLTTLGEHEIYASDLDV